MIAVPPCAMMALWQRRGEGRHRIDPVDQFCPERAKPLVVGSVCDHGADVFVFRDLVEQVWQNGAVHCPAVVCAGYPREGPSRLGVNSTARMSEVA